MATAPAAPQQKLQKPRSEEMVEVKAPEQFKFTKDGQTLSGILISIDRKPVHDNNPMEYTLVLEHGDRCTFLGSADLDKKIEPKHLGRWMEIRLERTTTEFQKPGQSPMKIYKVLAGKNIVPGYEHLQAA